MKPTAEVVKALIFFSLSLVCLMQSQKWSYIPLQTETEMACNVQP